MREILYIEIRDRLLIVDPVVDALTDIAKGKLQKCMYGTGISGYVTNTLDGGRTELIKEFPVHVASGHAHCTAMPDPAYTSNDEEYAKQYNQTIIHHLDSTRAATVPYTAEDIESYNRWMDEVQHFFPSGEPIEID